VLAVFDGVSGRPLGGVAATLGMSGALASAATARARGIVDVRQALTDAGTAVAQTNDQLGLGSATTGTVIVLFSTEGTPFAATGWVGDTSAFLIRTGRVLKITRPHVDREDQHQITRWMGDELSGEPEIAIHTLELGDRLLVVSDGITDVLTSEEIGGVVAAAPLPTDAANNLVRMASQRDSRDNMSVAVAFLTDNPASDPSNAGPLWATPFVGRPARLAAPPAVEASAPSDTETTEQVI